MGSLVIDLFGIAFVKVGFIQVLKMYALPILEIFYLNYRIRITWLIRKIANREKFQFAKSENLVTVSISLHRCVLIPWKWLGPVIFVFGRSKLYGTIAEIAANPFFGKPKSRFIPLIAEINHYIYLTLQTCIC